MKTRIYATPAVKGLTERILTLQVQNCLSSNKIIVRLSNYKLLQETMNRVVAVTIDYLYVKFMLDYWKLFHRLRCPAAPRWSSRLTCPSAPRVLKITASHNTLSDGWVHMWQLNDWVVQ